jgi:hypothetical protein
MTRQAGSEQKEGLGGLDDSDQRKNVVGEGAMEKMTCSSWMQWGGGRKGEDQVGEAQPAAAREPLGRSLSAAAP